MSVDPNDPYHGVSASTGFRPNPAGARVPTYLLPAILTTFFCCLPLGVVAIVFGAQVGAKEDAGDRAGAMRSSEQARRFTWISFWIGLVLNLLLVAFLAFAVYLYATTLAQQARG